MKLCWEVVKHLHVTYIYKLLEECCCVHDCIGFLTFVEE